MEISSKSKKNLLEQIYVHDVYDRLSSMTLTQNTTAWPNVRKFLKRIAIEHPNGLVGDIGCGTGKYLQLQSDLFTIGCDRSQQLCETVREKFVHVPILIADNLHLPYRENLFDAVLSIGVIHHLATHERRVQAIRECLRILKPNGGKLLIYTWALEQKQRQFSSQDVLVPCVNSQTQSDIILDNKSWSSSIQMNEKFFRHLEQDVCSPPPSPTNFSMLDSLQNLFQRFIKPTSSSSSSTPSTPKCSSHHDQFSFRIRPFPMSSFDNHDDETNTNPLNKRFYHVFKHGELESSINEASKTFENEIKILKSYYDHGNWCAIVQKL